MERPQIDGYILLAELGSGASGTVFAANMDVDAPSGSALEERAVKIYSGDRATQKFLRELHHLHAVRGHPNVAKFLASCHGTVNAIVMPLYRGLDLYSLVRQCKALLEVDAALVIRDLLAATQHIHQRGVLHRDIKPENIIVADGRAVLIDFDVACQLSRVDDPDLPRAGIAGYMSPEMVLRKPFGTPSDLFSVGCTMYFMFRKKPPFRSTPHSDNVVFRKTARCKFQFDVFFDDLSEACKSFISSLIIRLPTKRLTSEQALQHEWLTSREVPSHTTVVSATLPSADLGRNEQHSPSVTPDVTVALTQWPHQPSVFEAKVLVQESQQEAPSSSDTTRLETPQSSSSRSYVSKKPMPRRPSGNPTAPMRSSFRKHTFESRTELERDEPTLEAPDPQ